MSPIKTSSEPDQINEWTIMFYFGSDNPLAPLLVSQLKAIKDAGFQKNTDVLVYYDSNEAGTPTRIYNVNVGRKSKAKASIIGDQDNYIRNLSKDTINFATATFDKGKEFSKKLKDSLNGDSDNTTALDSLVNFINFGRESHKAKHYILFLVGHGMVVGNDAFLPDEAPRSAIKLTQLGKALRDFSDAIVNEGTLELLGLHSCSMSAVEVAYELKGSAKYMMASEGSSFVGSWPYRQLLKGTFSRIEKAVTEAKGGEPEYNVEEMVRSLYFLSLYTSTDFLLSGYSSDLALCSLDEAKLIDLREQIGALGNSLKRALTDAATKEAATEAIQLAHGKSQSYWNETYSDLYDLCDCLQKASASRGLSDIATASGNVIARLERDRTTPFSKLVIFSDHYGGKYQYSHGLSIFFPWTEPVEDPNTQIMENYAGYRFTYDPDVDDSKGSLPEESWLSFLSTYFKETMRPSRIDEDQLKDGGNAVDSPLARLFNLNLVNNAASEVAGSLGEQKASGAFDEQKASGAVGAGCSCNSIKNFPPFSISPAAALAFDPDRNDDPVPDYKERVAKAQAG